MERTFHMLLYRAFHAQRNFLRPSLGELGLGPGQPKLLNYLMNRGPCRQRELADYDKEKELIEGQTEGCWTACKRAAL